MTPIMVNQLRSVDTTLNYGASQTAALGRAGSQTRRNRVVLVYDISGGNTGRVEDFIQNLVITTTNTNGANFVVFPIVQQVMDLTEGTGGASASGDGMTYATINGVDAWTRAGADTTGVGSDPGHNVDTSVRATFAVASAASGTLSWSGDTLDDVVNAAMLAAIENNWTRIALLICMEDEAGSATATAIAVGTDDHTTEANRPTATFTLFQSPYDGWIFEYEHNCGFPGGGTFDVTVGLGDLTFGSGDEFWMEFGTAAQFVAGTGYTTTSSTSMNGSATGDVLVRTSGGCNVPGNVHRICATYNGGTYKSALVACPQTPTLGEPQIDSYRGDSHEIVAWNVAVTNYQKAAESLQVQDATDEHLNSRMDALVGVGRSLRFHDGAYMFAQLTSTANQIFPLATDGSGEAGASPTKHYALSQTDTNEVSRAFRRRSPLRLSKVFSDYVRSNHDPYHKSFTSANNPESNDAEVWSQTTLKSHRAVPVGIDPTTPLRNYTGESDGRYYARPWGNYLHCLLNPGMESRYGQADATPVTSPIPERMKQIADWTLGSTQFDFFFHSTTGKLATNAAAGSSMIPNVIIDIHNITGGSDGSSVNGFYYGRFGPNHLGTGEWWDTVHPAIVATRGSARVAVVMAHDHNWDWFFKDGVLYVWMPTPGQIGYNDDNIQRGPYSQGFFGTPADPLHSDSSRFKQNAGWVELVSSPSRMTFNYYATYIPTSPTDFTVPGATLVEDRIDGGLVASVSIPGVGGESRRPYGNRPYNSRPWTNRPANNR